MALFRVCSSNIYLSKYYKPQYHTCGPFFLSQPAVMKPACISSLLLYNNSFNTVAAAFTKGGDPICILEREDIGNNKEQLW